MNELIPSAKAGAEPLPAGSEACGCCEGVAAATARWVDNRGGLSAVGYRIGEWGDFRASLVAGLSQHEFAPLAALLTRESSDFTLGLIDAFACAADVLGFYQERIANESWLPTARERVSLQEMGRLIDYRLGPGVAAETWMAFAVQTPPAPPAGFTPEPGAFVSGVPEVVTLAAGLRVNSVPGPDEKPQAFETAESVEARWQWNAMRALADEERAPGLGARDAWLAGTATQLRVGDLLVFVGSEFAADPTSNRWDRRVLTAVEPDDAHQRTRVAWNEPLASVTSQVRPTVAPTVLAMRERLAIFGHNAPDWSGMSAEFKASYLGLSGPDQLEPGHLAEWPNFDIYAPGGAGRQITAHASALDAAQALQETLRGATAQQVRSGAMAAGQVVAGGAQFMQQAASLPAEASAAWMGVIGGVPEVLQQVGQAVMAPVATAAQASGQAVNATVSAVTSLQGVVTALRDVIRRPT